MLNVSYLEFAIALEKMAGASGLAGDGWRISEKEINSDS